MIPFRKQSAGPQALFGTGQEHKSNGVAGIEILAAKQQIEDSTTSPANGLTPGATGDAHQAATDPSSRVSSVIQDGHDSAIGISTEVQDQEQNPQQDSAGPELLTGTEDHSQCPLSITGEEDHSAKIVVGSLERSGDSGDKSSAATTARSLYVAGPAPASCCEDAHATAASHSTESTASSRRPSWSTVFRSDSPKIRAGSNSPKTGIRKGSAPEICELVGPEVDDLQADVKKRRHSMSILGKFTLELNAKLRHDRCRIDC